MWIVDEMLDYGSLVYLDLQKTGSTFVRRFMKFSCILKLEQADKHAPIQSDRKANTVYFITVRHPLSIYKSLYKFGLSRNGRLYFNLDKAGLSNAYSSFEKFVSTLLNPKFATRLGENFTERISEEVGFLSYRYMKLNLYNPRKMFHYNLENKIPLLELRKSFLASYTFKTERLREDLLELSIDFLPQFFDKSKAMEFLDTEPDANTSQAKDDFTLKSRDLTELLHFKEQSLFAFYQ